MTRIAAPRTASDPELAMAWLMTAAGVPMPQTEYRFDPERRWRFDFAWAGSRVALEVEGGTWIAGRHSRGAGYEADLEKYNAAAVSGWVVVRVTPAMVDDGRALAIVERALAARMTSACLERRPAGEEA